MALVVLALIWMGVNFVSLKNVLPSQADRSTDQKVHEKVETIKTFTNNFVLIDQGTNHDNTRSLVASIHRYHKDTRIILYGLNLNDDQKREIMLWSNVLYINANDNIFVSNKKVQVSSDYWKVLVFNHAIANFDSFVHIANGNYLVDAFDFSVMKTEVLNGSASFQSCNNGTSFLESDVFGVQSGSIIHEKYLVTMENCLAVVCGEKKLAILKQGLKDANSQCIPKKDLAVTEKTTFGYTQYLSLKPNTFTNSDLKDFLSDTTTPLNPQSLAIGIIFDDESIIFNKEDHLAFYNIFLSTLRQSDYRFANRNSKLYIYVGYEPNTMIFETPEEKSDFVKVAQNIAKDATIEFVLVPLQNTAGQPTQRWNALYQEAIKNGIEYFLKSSPSVRFESKKVIPDMINQLKENNNFGVVYPIDTKDPDQVHALVHKTHHAIFGSLFPTTAAFDVNKWIKEVYEQYDLSINMEESKVMTVYPAKKKEYANESEQLLKESVEKGVARVREYMDSL